MLSTYFRSLSLLTFIILTALTFFLAPVSASASFDLLHSFSTDPENGAYPQDDLTLVGSTFYGMTESGGASDNGTIFKINPDGTGFELLHSFASGDPENGRYPYGDLTLVGSTLYGMTRQGGASDNGTIFKINPDGTGFELLHSFASGDPENGRYPYGDLTLVGSTLYGMTYSGGANSRGTIFKINPDGTGFALLHSFADSDPGNGAYPQGNLTLVGSTFYGMTYYGGANGAGTVFTIQADGTGFELLHSFASGDPENGRYPYGDLTLVGSTLYGMTGGGGANDQGTIFSINPDGTGFALLHSFADSDPGNGAYPQGNLTLVGSTFYGMTYYGGANGAGTVFTIQADGTGFALLHSFQSGDPENGRYPYGDLTLVGSTLYGMTESGGASDNGTIFAFTLPDFDAPTLTLTPLGTITDTTPILTGTASDTGGTIASVEYQLATTTGSWSTCTADDGTFDSASEPFTCTLGTLATGTYTVYASSSDSNGNATTTSLTFTIVTPPTRGGGGKCLNCTPVDTDTDTDTDTEPEPSPSPIAREEDTDPTQGEIPEAPEEADDATGETLPKPTPTNASDDTTALIDLLISLGAIPEDKVEEARTLAQTHLKKSDTPSIPDTFRFTRYMKEGDAHEEVRMLQQFLNAHGFPVAETGPGSAGNETDYFGPQTKDAVMRFQGAYPVDILVPLGLTAPTGEFHAMSLKKANELLTRGR
jgi:uncharacterized repeat protein (TIGR03803 family)